MAEPDMANHLAPDAEVWELFDLLARDLLAGEASDPLARETATARQAEAIRRREDPRRPAPVSFGQRRLWFLDQLQPGNTAYHLGFGVRALGRLEIGALRRTLAEIVRRHEVLRTTFRFEDGAPVQVVHPAVPVPLPMIDVGALPAARARREQGALATAALARRFDLAYGPLLRALLVRSSGADHAVFFSLHHIVSDGWSTSVLIDEIAALYPAFAAGLGSPLPELAIQYGDFADWQQRWLSGERLERQLEFWRRELAGSPALLELPADRPRGAMQSFRGGRVTIQLGDDLSRRLEGLARAAAATPFMALLAGFQAWLARVCGCSDVVVGTPVANRSRIELERLVGFFVNTLALRSRVEGQEPFSGLLQRVRATCLAAYAHQDLPFEQLVEDLRPERNLSQTPIFQVLLALHQGVGGAADGGAPAAGATGHGVLRLPGMTLAAIELEGKTAKFDLSLYGLVEEEGLALSFEYAADLLEVTTAGRWLRQLQAVLEQVAAAPGRRLGDLELLSAAERQQVQVEWADTCRDAAPGAPWRSLGELLAERARSCPDALAVVFEEERLTYRELALRAGHLARELGVAGIAGGARVGVFLERSVELVVALVGVVWAGGAYVPLEPGSPRSRLAWMVEDAGLAAVVTRQGLEERLAEPAALPVPRIGLERGASAAATAGEVGEVPAPAAVAPAELAYVIYTSGSTGRPKGAMVPQEGIVNRLRWMQEAFELGAGDRVLQKTPFGFDVSVWEFFWPLLEGATLVVARPDGHQDPAYLAGLIARERVTVLHFVPSMLRGFLDLADLEALDSVRLLIASGEALPPDLVSRVRQRLPRAKLWNLYGPTEASVDVTAQRCDAAGGGVVPIGRPIANTRIVVLELFGDAVAEAGIGVVGELAIAGVQLARGYLGRPALTAERFVPAAGKEPPGGRLYRTGDLARWRRDGTLDYLGRRDLQVKVRGVRIELGEIEAALNEHPAVSEVAVAAQPAMPPATADSRLVAYLAARPGMRLPGVEALQEWLRQRLPESMVPARFVELPRLPLSPNGKVDRKALPPPEGGRPELAQAYTAPRTPLEEVLALLWSQALNLDRIGVHDSFFALGGDSIRSLQVLGEARRRGIAFELQQLFRQPTIAQLARQIESSRSGSGEAPAGSPFSLIGDEDRARIPAGIEDAYPLSRLQVGMIFHADLVPEQPLFHNVNGWRLRGPFAAAPFIEAVRRVVRRHAVLRTSFDLIHFSEPMQLVHREAELPVAIHDLRHLAPGEQEPVLAAHLAGEEARRFDLSRAPLMRFHIHRLDSETFLLSLTEHHAIGDGWSLHSTLAEIFTLYFDLLDGKEPAEPPPLATSFRESIRLEREAMAAEEQRRFWAQVLDGATPTELPPRWPPARQGAVGLQHVLADFEDDLLEQLRRLARRAAVPLKSLLIAAHVEAMALITGQSDILTGISVNGRPEQPDGERIRGLFVSVLPLRLAVTGGPLDELAAQVFAAEQAMLPYRRFPLSELQRHWRHGRLLETECNFTNFHVVEGLLRSGRIEVLAGSGRLEQTDMTLAVGFRLSGEADQLSLNLRYDTARVSRLQALRYLGIYRRLLESAARPAAGLDPLGPAERHQLLHEWHGARRPRPADGIHVLVAAQADAAPGACALVHGRERLSYRELDAGANRLARRLRAHGVRAEVVVGLQLGRSPAAVVAMLAVLKAGGAWVVFPPDGPRRRLDAIEAQTPPSLWLTESRFRERLDGVRGTVLCLDHEDEPPAAGTVETAGGEGDLEDPSLPDSLAYVAYTSGSTGQPKAILATRRGVLNYLLYLRETLGLRPGEICLQVAPLGFDASVRDIFGPLVSGGQVVLLDDEAAKDPDALFAAACEHGVESILAIVPTLLRELLEAARRGAAAAPARPALALCRLLVSGEPLGAADSRAVREVCGENVTLYNHYGPTECTMTSSFHRVRPEAAGPGQLPVGRPLDNVRCFLVNERFEPAAIGAVGELLIGGAGLARGYAGLPDRTAEAFVPDPWSGRAGARLYRTGDRMRFNCAGELEFRGRRDLQVKVRGVRVELEEVESALRLHPGVVEAAARLVDEAPAPPRLVAWWVAHPEAAAGEQELRAFLRDRLPEAMVPEVLVRLAALPRTAHGKLDRRALPAPEESAAEPRLVVVPRTPVEVRLAEIWCQVLRRAQVGVEDNFFALGGHSLTAVQMISRSRFAFGVELALRHLFLTPTLGGLAQTIESRLAEAAAGAEAGAGGVTLLGPEPEAWQAGGPEPDAAGRDLAELADSLTDEDLAALVGEIESGEGVPT